jgi:hypothetical protein
MEQEPIKKADISVEPEKVLAFEPVVAAEEPAVRVQLNNGLTVTLQGDEEVQTFEEAVGEYLEEGG